MERAGRYIFLAIFFIASSFRAQQVDTLDTVKIEADKSISPSKVFPVVKLSSQEINNHSSESLADLLSKETNLYIKNYSPGGLSTISIRGGGADRTKLYWNGIEINSPTLGQIDLSTIPVVFIDELEIHTGGSSIVDGSGALGGAIQLNSKADFHEILSTKISKELGSFGSDRTILKTNYGTRTIQGKSAILRYNAANNFPYHDISQKEQPLLLRENAGIEQFGLQQEIFYKPKVNHEIAIKANYFESFRELPSVIGVASNGEFQEDKNTRVIGEWSVLRKKQYHHLRMAYLHDELNYTDTTAEIFSKMNIDSYRGSYHFKHYFSDSVKLRVILSESLDEAISSGFSTLKKQEKESVYLHFEHLTKFRLLYNLSFRQEMINRKTTPLIPSVGFRYFLNKKNTWSIHGNGARNFKAPSLNDLYWNPGGNVNLQSEIGYSAEFGINRTTKETEINMNVFYALIDNWIQWLPTSTGYWSPVNVKKVENKGVEFSVRQVVLKNGNKLIVAKGSYQYIHSTNYTSAIPNDQSVGKQLIYVPKNTLNISLNITLNRLYIFYNQSVTGKTFVDAANTTYMPYYAPADLGITYSLLGDGNKNKGSIGLKIINLYNEEYQVMANRPLPGRWFLLSLKLMLQSEDNE